MPELLCFEGRTEWQVEADCHATTDALHARFVVAPMAGIVWPDGSSGRFVEGLWERTCFEVFLRAPGRDAYLEWNLSPAGEWAVWVFSDYRQRSALEVAHREVLRPRIATARGPDRFTLSALLSRAPWERFLFGAAKTQESYPVGLSVVLRHTDEALSHWALCHSGARPDFHDARTFLAHVR